MTRASLAIALVLMGIAVAGCGGSSSDSQAASAPSSSGASTDPSPAASSEGGGGSSSPGGSTSSPRAGNAAAAPGGQSPGSAQGSEGRGGKTGARVVQPTGPPEPKVTPQQRREATVVTMGLQSPDAVTGGGSLKQLPAKYTCDGANTWPTLQWSGTPAGTAELALFVMNVQPVEGRLFFDWAVTGIEPGLGEIETGKLPKGAVVGRNSFGRNSYSVCPPGQGEVYMFALYAMPEKVSAGSGFDPSEMRKQILGISGNAGLMALSYGSE